MDRAPFFNVNVSIEPAVIRSGEKGKNLEKKKALREAIRRKAYDEKIERAIVEGKGVLVSVTVEFRLWKGSASTSVTRSVKDVDNLAKGVLDVLKKGGVGEPGLGIIEGDEYVRELHASKRLVDDERDEGMEIQVTKVVDEQMLARLQAYEIISQKNQKPTSAAKAPNQCSSAILSHDF